jgi:hypothetical protein
MYGYALLYHHPARGFERYGIFANKRFLQRRQQRSRNG